MNEQRAPSAQGDPRSGYLVRLELDGDTLRSANPVVERERKVAIRDLLDGNRFAVVGVEIDGPLGLRMGADGDRLVWKVTCETGGVIRTLSLPLAPMKTTIKSYLGLIESYENALGAGRADHLESIDRTRRVIHDEGAKRLAESVSGKVAMDAATARGLFTLVVSLASRTTG